METKPVSRDEDASLCGAGLCKEGQALPLTSKMSATVAVALMMIQQDRNILIKTERNYYHDIFYQ